MTPRKRKMEKELCALEYAARLLGKSRLMAGRILSSHCAEMVNGQHEIKLFRVGRVLAISQGLPFPAPSEPLPFWSCNSLTRRIREMVGADVPRWQVQEILGEPDAIQVTNDREDPLWSHESANAAFQLIQESPDQFTRRLPFKRRVSAKRRRLIQRWQSRPKDFWKRDTGTATNNNRPGSPHLGTGPIARDTTPRRRSREYVVTCYPSIMTADRIQTRLKSVTVTNLCNHSQQGRQDTGDRHDPPAKESF